MKISKPVRASHLNSGTGVPRDQLPWPEHERGPVTRLPKLHPEIERDSHVTVHGGLLLASAFLRRFGVAREIDTRLHLLKLYLPYRESDHVLAQALNLYAGGSCLEDMAVLQQDPSALRMLGACRLPDPTTGGDFLRRFSKPGALDKLREAIEAVQSKVWKRLPRSRRATNGARWAVVDLDGHIHATHSTRKEGADFSYDKRWGFCPLLVSLAGSGELLAIENRPANVRSSEGAAQVLQRVLPRLRAHFDHILVRADSDFDRRDVREACEAHHAYFAFVGRAFEQRVQHACQLDDACFQPYVPPAQRPQRTGARRQRPGNRRRRRARERNFYEKRLLQQQVAETRYQPRDAHRVYRLIIRRQSLEHSQGQQYLFDQERDRYVVTNLPQSMSMHQVIDHTYQRCDQENLIAQLGAALAAWRMPVTEWVGNCAWLQIALLAWNMAKWIAQLALPAEVLRWEWKRFRRAFVYAPAKVVRIGRQTRVRFADTHRFSGMLARAGPRLQRR